VYGCTVELAGWYENHAEQLGRKKKKLGIKERAGKKKTERNRRRDREDIMIRVSIIYFIDVRDSAAISLRKRRGPVRLVFTSFNLSQAMKLVLYQEVVMVVFF
jgi:hypothetical protein